MLLMPLVGSFFRRTSAAAAQSSSSEDILVGGGHVTGTGSDGELACLKRVRDGGPEPAEPVLTTFPD